MPSIHFYDAVAFGKHPAEGQLLRYDFARYSEGAHEAATYSIRLRDDVFVDPATAEKDDIALQDFDHGLTELAWARIAHQQFTAPDTLHVAYGATGRLEQFIRFGMYRNLLPFPSVGIPDWLHYLDLETLTLAVRLLRPEEFPWQDLKSVRYQALHHALTWDCRLQEQNRAFRVREILGDLYRVAPRIVEHSIRMSSMRELKASLGLDEGEVSDMATVRPSVLFHPSIAGANEVLLALPVAVDVTYPDMLFVADLQADLSDLCDPANKQLKSLVRTHPNDASKPLVRVSLSRLPFCAPLNTIRKADAARLGIDMSHVQGNIARLRQSGFLPNRLKDASLLELPGQPFDVYHRMWAGDFPPEDQERMRKLHASPPNDWLQILAGAMDGRFVELGERLVGREYPDLLSEPQRAAWTSHVQSRVGGDFKTTDWLATMRKRAEDSAMTFPAAVGLVKLNERLARIFGGSAGGM